MGVRIIAVYFKCKKRSAKIYRLARKTGKTTDTLGYNAVPVCTEDKHYVYLEEDNSTQHEKDSGVLTGVKQKQHQKEEVKSTFLVLKLALPVKTQV